ncbi:MAG: carboxypeptidase-like regulatory domain-containing protein [Ginsengibacter sp.]
MTKTAKRKWAPATRLRAILILLIILSTSVTYSQKIITGKVFDAAANQPVAKATVAVKGKAASVVTTNQNGEYSINASTGDMLVFTSSEYQKEEVRVGAGSAINVNLSQNVTTMNDVVVVGYGTTSRKNLTLHCQG